MYKTTDNPTVMIDAWSANGIDRCPTKVNRYPMSDVYLSQGYVTSWRGKKDLSQCRSFERWQYDVTGMIDLWYCNPAGKVDGGKSHAHKAWNLNLYPQHIKLTDEDVSYKNHLVAELYQKVNDPRFNSAVFFAELAESIYYITDLVKTLVRMTRFTKGVIQRGANPDEAWLEWRYAVQPLMLTVQHVIEAIEAQGRPKEKVQDYKKHEPNLERREYIYSYDRGTVNYQADVEMNYSVGAGLWIDSQKDESPWGTSLNDVIAAGWEVVPASFIIDWFLDVGTWIGSWRDTNLMLDRRYCTVVKTCKAKVWVEVGNSSAIGTFYEGPTEDAPFWVKSKHIVRYIDDDVTPPLFPSLVPGQLSLLHKCDAAALIMSLLKGVLRR